MKIGLVGTVSVGKTTLVNELKKIEFFNDYEIFTEKSKEIQKLGVLLNTDSTLLGQNVFMGYRSIELMKPKIITDRTIIDVMAFTYCSQSIPNHEKKIFIKYASTLISEYDHVFYVSPIGVSIENNGVRETNAEYRDLIDLTIKMLIKENLHKINNFSIISGTTEERIKQVKFSLGL